jgi:uncharacterized HAD superfamily protein/hypoxanthine-guanine phosphoribosyltransferase
MHFKSFGDLARDIATNLARVPLDVDLIVGIPRSGMMAASMLALMLNKKFCDVASFLDNRSLQHGRTRMPSNGDLAYPLQARTVLILDDSVDSGASIRRVLAEMEVLREGRRFITAAIYASKLGVSAVDVYFEQLDMPRVFAWNLFHRNELAQCCVDIDGVLCNDPTHEENDDGPRYLRFLESATPLARPTYRIGHLVTSRLARYRAPTERWLQAHGIQFDQLHMLDLPSAAERRRQNCHAAFKADVYRSIDAATLFIESDPAQAVEIARLSGKPVLDYTSQRLAAPVWNAALLAENYSNLRRRIANKLKHAFPLPLRGRGTG